MNIHAQAQQFIIQFVNLARIRATSRNRNVLKMILAYTSISTSLQWVQAHQVSKLNDKPNSFGAKVAAVLLAPWYNAFKIAEITPFRNEHNSGWHTLGKIFRPTEYSAFQMAKMKSPDTSTGEKALALLASNIYGVHASSVLAERVHTQKLNVTSAPPAQVLTPITAAEPSPMTSFKPPAGYQLALMPTHALFPNH